MATSPPQRDSGIQSEQSERYTHGYETVFVDYLKGRTVAANAAFLLPYLRAGMSLLDCGCGPGTITSGLSRVVTPGQVVGIDIEESQIHLAREQAALQALPNIRFEVASVYDIPFPDETFDVAFAHTVLEHLSDPLKALREIHRVLKPGGIVAVREEDNAGFIFAPTNPMLEEAMGLFLRTWQHNGGDPYFARHHRAVLRDTGFVRTKGTATVECYGTPQETSFFGTLLSGYFAARLETAVVLGWADKEKVEQMSKAWEEWGHSPDAYLAILRCEAIAWKP